MPCSFKRARQLLDNREAVVHKQFPFTIRLKKRLTQDSQFQDLSLKIDPGSKTTGFAITMPKQSPDGIIEVAMFLAEMSHHSDNISKNMESRSSSRRGRRTRNLRYRAPRYLNRTKPRGWLPPSVRSRVDNVMNFDVKIGRLCRLTHIDIESALFDMQKMINPAIQGEEYQQGTLAGYELREYLLEKYKRTCVYCGAKDVPLNLDHWIPKNPRKGEEKGSDRIGNLVLACIPCNQKKKNTPGPLFVKDKQKLKTIQVNLTKNLASATHTNILRKFIYTELCNKYGAESVGGHYSAQTKYNRHELGVNKSHSLDALCCGDVSGVKVKDVEKVLMIKSIGRGKRQMVQTDRYGFPTKSIRSRSKKMDGYQTGDICKIQITTKRSMADVGMYVGRVTKSDKAFAFKTSRGTCKVRPKDIVKIIHRNDGYDYKIEDVKTKNINEESR